MTVKHSQLRALRGATWNVERDRTPKSVRRYLRRMTRKHRLDFVLLQEFADYTHHLQAHPIKGYTLVSPSHKHGERQNPILVSNDVRVQYPRVVQLSEAGWYTVGGHMHEPASSVVALLDGWLRVASIHAPVSVSWQRGRPKGPSRRVAAYVDHSERLIRFVRDGRRKSARRVSNGCSALVNLLGGDWNARTWERGRCTPFWLAREAELHIAEPKHRKGPGHDGIDYALCDGRVSSVRKHRTGGSDHPFVTFRVHPPVGA